MWRFRVTRSFFGTGKTIRVDAIVDDLVLENFGAMVTGSGGHMVTLNATARKALGKDNGDAVDVTITQRWACVAETTKPWREVHLVRVHSSG